jgi:hypothetical protein
MLVTEVDTGGAGLQTRMSYASRSRDDLGIPALYTAPIPFQRHKTGKSFGHLKLLCH